MWWKTSNFHMINFGPVQICVAFTISACVKRSKSDSLSCWERIIFHCSPQIICEIKYIYIFLCWIIYDTRICCRFVLRGAGCVATGALWVLFLISVDYKAFSLLVFLSWQRFFILTWNIYNTINVSTTEWNGVAVSYIAPHI